MNKKEFIEKLSKGISSLSKDEIAERVTFYSEMIDDIIEDGVSEEDAVSQIGNVDEIIAQIISENPNSTKKTETEKVKENKNKKNGWKIAFIATGSPLFIVFVVVLFALVISLFAVLWSAVASLWAGFVSLVVVAPSSLIGGIILVCTGKTFMGIATMGASVSVVGVSILFFVLCKIVTKASVELTKTCVKFLKSIKIRR